MDDIKMVLRGVAARLELLDPAITCRLPDLEEPGYALVVHINHWNEPTIDWELFNKILGDPEFRKYTSYDGHGSGCGGEDYYYDFRKEYWSRSRHMKSQERNREFDAEQARRKNHHHYKGNLVWLCDLRRCPVCRRRPVFLPLYKKSWNYRKPGQVMTKFGYRG